MDGTEREFLHEISNPICIAHGMLELAVGKLKKENQQDTDPFEKISKALNALERSMNLIQERRTWLKSQD